MTDWGRWLPGLGSDDEDDPVKKTLRALGLGQSAAPEPAPSYNDPTANGTLARPLPVQQPAESAPFQDTTSAEPMFPPWNGTAPEGPAAAPEPAQPAFSLPDVASPVWGAMSDAGSAIGRGIQGVTDTISQNMAGNRQAVEDANAGQTGGVDFGTGAANAAQDIGTTVASEGIATPIARAISTPIREAIGKPPLPDTGRPETTIDRAIVETGRSLGRNIGAVQSGIESGDYGEAALGGLGVVGDLAPSTTLARQLNEMTPHGQFPGVGEVGLGDAIMTAALARDAARLGYGAIKAGGSAGASIVRAIQEGVPAERFAAWTRANAERVAAADARMAEQGSTGLPATLGAVPEEFGRPYPDIRRDVGGVVRESLGEPSAEMLADSRYPRDAVHPDLRAAGIGPEITPQIDLSGRMNAAAGLAPEAAGPDRLASVNRVLGQGVASSISGGVGAQVNEQMHPDDPYARLKGFAAGALVPPLAARGGMALARRAGRSTELGDAARIALGDVPPSKIRRPELPGMESLPARRVGEVPLAASPGDAAARAEMRAGGTALPGLEGLAAERFAPVRAAVPGATPSEAAAALSEMRAGGAAELPSMPPPKGPSFWEWLKKIGYTGLIGPSSAVGQTVGGLMQAGLGTEKAVARAVAEGRPGSAPRIVGSALGAVPEGFRSLFEVMRGGQAPAGISDAWGGGTARMADRVQTPLGKAAARALDYSTELWAQAPDAFFSPIFRAIGEREAAEQIAQKTGSSAGQLLTDAAAARSAGARGPTSAVQDVMDAGQKLADDLGMKGDPGSFGQKLAALSKKDSAAGFLASFLLPFPSMTVRSLKATGRLVPGVGEVIGRAEGRDAFERLHDQTLGPLALAAMGYYATQGGITGSGPTDKGRRDILAAQGWQAHSILTPAGYVPTRYFQQFAPILDAVGELHDGYAYGKGGADKGAIVGDLATRLGKLATDQVGLGQLNDLLQVLDGSQSADQNAALAARSLGRYIPFGATLRQVGSALDPTARRAVGSSPDEYLPTTSFIQNLEQGLPGLRSLVPERQDVLGRAMPNPQRGLQPAMRAVPMLRAFERAGMGVGDPPSTIKDASSGADRRLTDAQQARWRTAYGRALRSGWADNGMPTDRDALGAVRSAARAEADAVVGG